MPPGTFAAAGAPRAAYIRPLQIVPKNGVYGWFVREALMPLGTPCAAANTPGGINSSPTHCPQTIFCLAGRRGRRPLRRNVFLFVPPGTNSTFFIIYYLLSLIYLLFAPFVV